MPVMSRYFLFRVFLSEDLITAPPRRMCSYIDETGCLLPECVGDGCKLLRTQLPELLEATIASPSMKKRKRQLLQLLSSTSSHESELSKREEKFILSGQNHVLSYSCKSVLKTRAEIDDVVAKPFRAQARVIAAHCRNRLHYVVASLSAEQFVAARRPHHGSAKVVRSG